MISARFALAGAGSAIVLPCGPHQGGRAMSAAAGGAAAGGAAAAAAAALAAQQEEEEMTPYGAKDLAEDWEFKILRSATNRFRDPIWLNAILQEEARAGWKLVEKFDDGRVRL